MPYTLAQIIDKVEINLLDETNLIWSVPVVTEAIRAALTDLSRIRGTVLTLNGLDGAVSTTLADLDHYVVVRGAVAYALLFRVVGRFEEATPEPKIAPSLAAHAEQSMQVYREQLALIDIEVNGFVHDEYMNAWKSAENVLDRNFKSNENLADRIHESSNKASDRLLTASESIAQRGHETAENALDRALKEDLLQAQYDREDALKAAEDARLTGLQESTDGPVDTWDWKENGGF